jgi:hypothetical protein
MDQPSAELLNLAEMSGSARAEDARRRIGRMGARAFMA